MTNVLCFTSSIYLDGKDIIYIKMTWSNKHVSVKIYVSYNWLHIWTAPFSRSLIKIEFKLLLRSRNFMNAFVISINKTFISVNEPDTMYKQWLIYRWGIIGIILLQCYLNCTALVLFNLQHIFSLFVRKWRETTTVDLSVTEHWHRSKRD